MNVSSNSLFHFTNSIENLENILSERFYLTYCKEEFTLAGKGFHGYYPMISFCDLPLSLAKEQFSKYGNYAIGLSKEWGVKNKLNPVIYIEQNSGIAHDLQNTRSELMNSHSIIAKAVKEKKLPLNVGALKELLASIGKNVDNFINTLRYTKNYSGTLKRGDKTIPNYRFYDEREWRYIPEMSDTRLLRYMTKEQYTAYRGDGKKPLIKEINIPFDSKDIKYMILKSDEEIPRLVSYLKTNSSLTANEEETNILTTKIITCQQLERDF